MTLSPEQFEAIVREVMRRLASMQSPDDNVGTNLSVEDRVVTTHTLDGRLNGVRKLTVGAGAVVTPSAKDLLREHNVELVR